MANLDLAGIITRVCTDLKEKFSKVSVSQSLTSGSKVGTIVVDGTSTDLYAPTPPSPTTALPLMDGTASFGSGTAYARYNHRHPTDTSRQATLISGTNIKTINGESLLGSGDLTISGGGSAGGLLVTITSTSTSSGTTYTTDKTAGEIFAALESGVQPVFKYTSSDNETFYLTIEYFKKGSSGYSLSFAYYWTWELKSSSPDGYMTHTESGGGGNN